MTTLVADSSGVVLGQFTIPPNVLAGTKEVVFTGAGGSVARPRFAGAGVLVTDTRTLVTQITTTPFTDRVDPIAQTFTLNQSIQLDGIDLFFVAVGSTRVSVQIRETQTGFPTQQVLAESIKVPGAITVGAFTTFRFRSPVSLVAGTEYAIVVLCNDAVSELAIAEIGKFDTAANRWVTSQPYTVGVLLSSSNASTWTPYQDRDLTFRLIARQYTEASRLVDLGNVTLTGLTDALLFAIMEAPTSFSQGELQLTLPSGTIVKSGDYQRIQLAPAVSGTGRLKALLRSDGSFASSVLHPGSQIGHGVIQASGVYNSVAVAADAAGAAVNVYLDAIIPSGATITVEISGTLGGDTFAPMTYVSADDRLLDGNVGLYERHYQTASILRAMVKIRITITGTSAARPRVRSLRMIVT